MDLKVLKNFIEIVDSGSLTAASKKLFIAQPALSNQLKSLEKDFNAVLIERNSRHQKLTDAGRLFYEKAKSILRLENALTQEIADTCEGNIGTLKIATIQSGEIDLLQEILPAFVENYPKITYEIHEKESDDILQLLENGTVEIGVVCTPCSSLTPEMDVMYISDEKLVCAYDPEMYSFDSASKKISLHDLKDLPILIIRRYEEMFRSLCELEGFTPFLRAINKQLTINLKWAEAGLGIAIVPKNSLSYCKKPLAYKEIEEEGLSTKRAIVTMKNSYHSKAVKNFLNLCKESL